MNDFIKIERVKGVRSLPIEDNISGLIAYLADTSGHLSSFDENTPYHEVSSMANAEGLGVTKDSDSWNIRALYYQLSEVFRSNPDIKLYLCVCRQPAENDMPGFDFNQIKGLQTFAQGRIRQMAIWTPSLILDEGYVSKMVIAANDLEKELHPLSILYAPKVAAINALPTNLNKLGNNRISIVIGQAAGKQEKELLALRPNNGDESLTSIGLLLGLLSRAKVNESIAWVRKFETGVAIPGFSDGKLLKEVDKGTLQLLENGRYIFFTTYKGICGSFINDSHNLDEYTSDYSMIESVRSMDKVVRNIYTYLIPELGSSLYMDPETGRLETYTIQYLETVAGRALLEMEKAGEIADFTVEIDPNQDVLSTSSLVVNIKKYGFDILRKITLKVATPTKNDYPI